MLIATVTTRGLCALYLIVVGVVEFYRRVHGSKRTRYVFYTCQRTRTVTSFIWGMAMLCYIFNYHRMKMYELPVHAVTRDIGVLVFSLSFLLWGMSQYYLGDNWSPEVAVKEGHQLISRGPYKFIRHPMYTSYILAAMAITLVTANWVLSAVTWVYMLLTVSRAWAEEEMMITEVGLSYQQYKRTTGRFWPRLKCTSNVLC